MSTNTAKKAPAPTTSSTGAFRMVAPSAFQPGVIQDAIDLGGDGYMLVKVADPGKLRTSRAAKPGLAPADVLRLVRRLVGNKRQRSLSVSQSNAAEDNTTLLAGLEASAMAGRQRLYEAGELVSSATLRERLQVSRQALSKAVADKRMFWVDGPRGAQWYPGFFATSPAHRRDIERVSVQLGDLPGAVKWQFFTSSKHSLDGRTPLQVLGKGGGGVERVLRSAAEFRERSLGR